MESLEQIAFKIISASGDALSTMLNALKYAKEGSFEKAEELMEESQRHLSKAHSVQTNLIIEESRGNKSEYSILMVHAQDHIMNATLATTLIREMIDLYKNKA